MRRIRIGRGVASLGLIAVIGAACNGESESSGGLVSGDDYSVADAVSEIPPEVVGDDILISTGDLVQASEAAGIDLPETFADVPEWILAISNAGADGVVHVPFDEYASAGYVTGQIEEFEEEVGYSILDIEAFVELSNPPDAFAVVTGDLDGDSLSGGLDDLGDGVVSHGTGEDFETDLENASAVSRIGRPTRFAEDGGRIAISPSTPAVEGWIAGDGAAPTAQLEEIAARLDDADVFAGLLLAADDGFSAVRALGPAPDSAVQRVLEQEWLPPAPFDTVGIGWGVDDGRAVVTVVFAHDSDDAAEDNAEAFEAMFDEGESLQAGRPLEDLYDVQDISVDGGLVTVRLHPAPDTPPSLIHRALVQGDAPFIHA